MLTFGVSRTWDEDSTVEQHLLQAEASVSKAEEESQVQQLKGLFAAHESELRAAQEAAQSAELALTAAESEAQKRQAELHASHSQELMKLHETHSADLRRLSAIQAEASQISHLLESSNDMSRHPQDLSSEEIGRFAICNAIGNGQSCMLHVDALTEQGRALLHRGN